MSEEETAFEFPCQFPIKAMGKTTPTFNETVVNIVLQHIKDLGDYSVKTTLSRGGKFTSITVTIEANSKKQLDAIYQGLTDCPDVMITL